jgi:hypothetical protein
MLVHTNLNVMKIIKTEGYVTEHLAGQGCRIRREMLSHTNSRQRRSFCCFFVKGNFHTENATSVKGMEILSPSVEKAIFVS